MAFRKNNPGCPCCDPCKIDAFTAEIEIEDANQATIRPAVHPQSPYPSWLRADVKAETTAIVRLLFLWDDSSPGDGIYVEFIPDSPTSEAGSISVYTKDDTRIAGPWYVYGGVSDAWHTITVCYDPDTDPNELMITFDPDGETYPTQSFNVMLPSGMTVGRKSGYGTGNGSGSVWFRNYQFDRLWYCGNSPYTSDCHEQMDGWDYYYSLPTRTICHPCERCPDGETLSFSTNTPNYEEVGKKGQSGWHTIRFSASVPGADEAIVGVSDIIGYNKSYLVIKCTGGPSTSGFGYQMPSVTGGFYYDEGDGYDQLYFWLEMLTPCSFPVETLVYEVFRVTNGGSPTSIMGPTSVTATIQTPLCPPRNDLAITDNYTSIHAPMRNLYVGTGVKIEEGALLKTIVSESFDECQCYTTKKPRKYTATVAGVAAGTIPFTLSYLNRGPLTLRNYYHYDPDLALCHQWTQPTIDFGNCVGTNWEVKLGPALLQTFFTAQYNGDNTILQGFAYLIQRIGVYSYVVELRFAKTIYGRTDIRALSGEVLPFYEMVCANDIGPGSDCLYNQDWVDASSATFTITAVP